MCNKLLFSILFFICTNGFAQTTLYVDSAAIGNNNGSNWSNAFTSLTKALDSAWRNTGIDSILVAKGNYTPMYFPYQMISGGTGDTMTSLSDNRQRVFHIRQGLELYGGYNATTGSRNISFNQTVLNGAHVGGVVNDSAYHVVLADSSLHWQNILDSTVIDGFKIMNGVANSSGNTTVNNNVIWNYHGAGLYVTLQSGFNLSNCTISYNSGIQYASGAYINCAYGKVFFDNNIVNFNTGPSEAIGIDCHYDEKNSVIINSDISNNNNGGGLRIGCFNSPLIVRNNTFRNNTGIAGVFGGLKIQGSGPNNIIVTNNEISSNIGGIEISASNNSVLTIENNTIKNNNGLGWTNAGIDIFCPTGTLYFNNNSILNNIGTDGGGEIASYGGVVYLNGNIFNNNSATGGAGGLTISTTAGTSILNKNIFSNNSSTATNSAGGLHIGSANCTTVLRNNVICNNFSGGIGGATIGGSGTTATLINNTFNNNITSSIYAGGLNFSASNGTLTLSNNIFWENESNFSTTSTWADIRVFQASASACFLDYNLLQLGSSSNYSSSFVVGTNNIYGTNPMFSNANNIEGLDSIYRTSDDGLYLQVSSPAIAAGTISNSPNTDIIGNNRSEPPTIGAYEYYCTTESIDTIESCGEYTWINGITYFQSDSTAKDTLVNMAGCDSIISLNLTINNVNSIDSIVACNFYTWIDGISYTESTDTVIYTIVNGATNGCDSIITLDLTIINSTNGVDVHTTCDAFTWINGTTYTENVDTITYTIVNGSSNGCDSIVLLDLTINNVNDSIIQQGFSLYSNANNAAYQWVDCDNNYQLILNETAQVYNPMTNGVYAVIVSQNGCTDTSNCISITGLNVDDLNIKSSINIYYSDELRSIYITAHTNNEIYSISLYNLLGEMILNDEMSDQSFELNTVSLPNGLYILKAKNKNKIFTFKILLY